MFKSLIYFLICFILLIVLFGCSASKVNEKFEGEWNMILPFCLFSGHLHNFFFTPDSFLYRYDFYSDAFPLTKDSCDSYSRFGPFFAAGKYKTKNGKLIMSGNWTDSLLGGMPKKMS